MKQPKTTFTAADIPTLTLRKVTALKRRNNRKRPSKRKLAIINKKHRATLRRKKAERAQLAVANADAIRAQRKLARKVDRLAIPNCQHPRARSRGVCACPAIGTRNDDGTFTAKLFDIPTDYTPECRFAGQPELPRPQAYLCVQHHVLIDSFTNDDEDKPADWPHRRQCTICQHADPAKVERTLAMWLNFTLKGVHAAAELGVSYQTFMHHCYYYRLDEKQAEKGQTRKYLLGVMDASIGAKASAKDGIAAAAQLSRERGDVQNVDMRLAVKDLANLSDAELAAMARQAAAKLEAEASSKAQGDV